MYKERVYMNKPFKLSAQEIYDSLSPSLPMYKIFQDFNLFIDSIIELIFNFKFSDDLKSDLTSFISLKLAKNIENNEIIDGKTEIIGSTILLSHMGISREQIKNIVFAYYPKFVKHKNLTLNKVLNDKNLKDIFINLLINGFLDEELKTLLSGDTITLNRFNLSKYKSLIEVFHDRSNSRRILEDAFKSRIQNKKGYSAEKDIIASVLKKHNINYASGKLEQLESVFERASIKDDKNKRNPKIDLIIPNSEEPVLLIESTYQQTTASGQTKKIDANDSLFTAIKKLEKQMDRELIFINFVDGAGWKKRGLADVSRLVSSCDYVFNFKNMNHFEEILKYYFKK